MASPSLRFVFLLACVVNVAKATEEATNDHEDVEAILRELQAEPAPDMAGASTMPPTTAGATTMPPTTTGAAAGNGTTAAGNVTTSGAATSTPTVTGAFTVTLSVDASVILNNATVKANFEDGVKTKIATSAGVSKDVCTVTASAGTRRLESAEPRQLAGSIKIDYSIATSSAQSATVLANVKTFMQPDNLKTVTQAAIQGIDAALCPQCANATVTQAVVTTAPTVTTSASSSNTDTSSADRSHVLWAIFSFAATWVL